jgi:prolyl-tRNA synthetase
LHDQLTAAGVDVLLDDRDCRAGVKFKDADLIGIPLRVVIGDRGLKEGKLEIKWRWDQKAEMIDLAGGAETLIELIGRERADSARYRARHE